MMDSEMEVVEQRLKSFPGQLRTEHGILDRMVYKNKNQHRRCSYFQHLLKVRRDLRLLQSANLEEILNSTFDVISGKRPRQKVQLLESLKRRRVDSGKFNFLERLLGVARLLSQMVEPMLKAATEISTLLARSFFMGFSLTILSLLARLRVLVQQILLDVVCVFNTAFSLSRKEQAVKLNQQGFEVLREYYPTKEEQVISLECVWQTDKFVLVEKTNEGETKSQGENTATPFPSEAPTIQYQRLEVLLEDNESNTDPKQHASGEDLNNVEKGETSSQTGPIHGTNNDEKQVEDGSVPARSPGENTFTSEDGLLRSSDSAPSSSPLKLKSGSKDKVAFISIKRPAPSTANSSGLGTKAKASDKGEGEKEDPFFSLLTGGNMESSLF